ncbi:MAG: tryptophan synthase subunit alpha, partial [Candidatus Aminicenantes bacterium]|nr:tryptophan synthase subunit alpha [Candidatus Aminicenantes bacterium]
PHHATPHPPSRVPGPYPNTHPPHKPVAVGFGISKPAQVSMLSAVADGIIVGSAIIKLIEAHTIKKDNDLKAGPDLVKKVGEFIGELKKATRI